MKILIVSDSHLFYNLEDLQHLHTPDLSIHAGDSQLKYNDDKMQYMNIKVRGNCDFDNLYQDVCIYEDIFVTHGHLFNVKYSLDEIVDEAIINNCKYAIYGHSHVVDVEKKDGVICINPGSVTQSRSHYPTTYMILYKDKNIIDLYDAKTNKVIETFKI